MSKSLGNVICPQKLLDDYGVDPVRYFLLREGGIVDDGNFTEDALKVLVVDVVPTVHPSLWLCCVSRHLLQGRINNDLADTLGNLLSRCTAANLLPSGELPPCGPLLDELPQVDGIDESDTSDVQLVKVMNELPGIVSGFYEDARIDRAIDAIVMGASEANRYIATCAPWKVAKKVRKGTASAEEVSATARCMRW